MNKIALALFALFAFSASASAQVIPPGTNPVPAGCAYFLSGAPSPVSGQGFWLQCDVNGNLKIAGSFSAAGTTSNATSGVATSSTNTPNVAYNYGFNGTTWDQLQVDTNKNLKVSVQGAVNIGPTDCSGTITTGGTAQNAFAANAGVHGFTIMNLSTDPMWISFTTTAAIGSVQSYLLGAGSTTTAGGSYSSPLGFGINTALSVIAATTADKWSCTRW